MESSPDIVQGKSRNDYISDRAWSILVGVELTELHEIALEHKVFQVPQGRLLLRPSPEEKQASK